MRKFTCVIIDDEPLACQVISHYLESIDQLEVLSVFTNALDAFSFLKSHHTDLIFLDIEMPGFYRDRTC